MKRVNVMLGVMVFSLFFMTTICRAADKFAYVDVMRIASEYNKAKDHNKSLDEKAGTYEAEIDKRLNEIKKVQDKVNLMNDKQKEAKRPELEKKVKDLQEYRRQKEVDLRKEDFENTKEIVEDIRGAIKRHAEKEGYAMVFDDRALVYQGKGTDITNNIVSILNKEYKK